MSAIYNESVWMQSEKKSSNSNWKFQLYSNVPATLESSNQPQCDPP
jgi:hypothetical protein